MSSHYSQDIKEIASVEESGGFKAAKQKKTIRNESVYKHLPLESGAQQIRLFRVENERTTISSIVLHLGRRDALVSSPIVETTNNKDHSLQISKNLSDFLRVFAKKHLRKWIWIDQLCINQNDLAERNDQVQRMGEIYTKASEVLIWLEPNAATDEIYNRQADLSKLLDSPERKATLVAQLIENAYFDRLWVVQEMVLAESLKIHYRDVVLDWADLRAFLHHPPAGFRQHTMKVSTKWLFENAARAEPLNKSTIPLDTLQYFCSSGCQDRKDVIYALQTLWDERDHQRVDYSRRTTTVFIEAVFMLLAKFLTMEGLSKRRPSFILAQVSTQMELDVQGCRNYDEREAFFKAELDTFPADIAGDVSTLQVAGEKLLQTLREKLFVNPEVKKLLPQGSSNADPKVLKLINMLSELRLLTEERRAKD